jgi:prevent-host-death family protein
MEKVTIRELRNRGGEVVDRVASGAHIMVTRDGRPVAELSPVRRRGLTAATLLERWRRLPSIDPQAVQRDVDAVIDPNL